MPDASHNALPASAGPAAERAPDVMLVARVQAGNMAAFEAIFDRYAAKLIAFAHTQLQSRELAEEVVQDLFFAIWRRRAEWRVERSLQTYLYQATRNQVINRMRAERVRRRVMVAGEADVIADVAAPDAADARLYEAELHRLLDQAVATLPPRNREVFTLVRGQGLTHVEVAEILGISVKAVEAHMARAFHALRLALARWQR